MILKNRDFISYASVFVNFSICTEVYKTVSEQVISSNRVVFQIGTSFALLQAQGVFEGIVRLEISYDSPLVQLESYVVELF